MIARVRIAPPKQWCPSRTRTSKLDKVSGSFVEIDTTSMRPSKAEPKCEGKEWRVTRDSAVKLGERMELDYRWVDEIWICEHMLEMD
jgi:hypothetical protein